MIRMGDLDYDAEAEALEEVKRLFRNHGNLDKLDERIDEFERREAATAAMLRNVVQSQVNGVSDTVEELEKASENLSVLTENQEKVDSAFEEVESNRKSLEKLFNYSRELDMMNNLRRYGEFKKKSQQTIQDINDLIVANRYLEAHKRLHELMVLREDTLGQDDARSQTAIEEMFRSIEDCWKLLRDAMFSVFDRMFDYYVQRPEQLVSCIRIAYREKWDFETRTNPPKQGSIEPETFVHRLLNQILPKRVNERVMKSCFADTSQDNWIVHHFEYARRTLHHDLCVVKDVFVHMFPPESNIFDHFLRLYHNATLEMIQETLTMIREKADAGPAGRPAGHSHLKNLYQLITWISNTYMGNECLNAPDLLLANRVVQLELPLLLDSEEMLDLRREFLELTKKTIKEQVGNIVDGETKRWRSISDDSFSHHDYDGPDGQRPDWSTGYVVTVLPTDLFACLKDFLGMASSAGEYYKDKLLLDCLQVISETATNLQALLKDYHKEFWAEETKKLLPKKKPFILNPFEVNEEEENDEPAVQDETDKAELHIRCLVASTNNCEKIQRLAQEVMDTLKPVSPENYAAKMNAITVELDRTASCALDLVMESIFKRRDRYTPEDSIETLSGTLLTAKWLDSTEVCNAMMERINNNRPEMALLRFDYYKKLTEKLLQSITALYIAAILRRKSYRNAAERMAVGEQVIEEMNFIYEFFSEQILPNCVNHTVVVSKLSRLLTVADCAPDFAPLAMELSALAPSCAGITEDQIMSILLSRGDVRSRSDVTDAVNNVMQLLKSAPSYNLFELATSYLKSL